MAYKDYTDKSASLEHWLTEIAPKYFDFDTSELNRASQFGYMNEIMSTVENDTHHSVSIARREFYPTTAKYLKSFYKMAALHEISYPMANPAIATAILIIKESDILKYGTQNFSQSVSQTDTYEFVIDNCMQVYAGNIPFMFDYPIIITCKKSKNVFVSGTEVTATKYAYTVRYDVSTKNSLNNQHSKYIKSRVYRHSGETLLLIKVAVRQCTIQKFSQAINKSPVLNNVFMDFNIDGNICNFEAFYTEAYSDVTYQLEKLPINSNEKNTKFCMWQMVDPSTLRLSFPANRFFNPRYNSTVDVNAYVTLGEAGNFAEYKGPVACITNSEKYPYNNLVTITGKIIGSSIGGYNFPTIDDFKNDVIAAYATNKTYTTDQDLQIMFDKEMHSTRNRIIFSKRRDDVLERLYGAYVILKDLRDYVMPTNSTTAEIINEDITKDDIGTIQGDSIIIRPGTVWKYHSLEPEEVYTPIYKTDEDGNIEYDENGLPMVIPLWKKDENGEYVYDENHNRIPVYVRDMTKWEEDENGDLVHPYAIDENGAYIQDIETIKEFKFPDGRDYVMNSEERKYMVFPTNILLNTFIDDNNDYVYTNPYLIRANLKRDAVAYYQNSFDTTIPLDLYDVNNESFIQFNMTGLNIYRNAVAGENFYKLTVSLQPSISDTDLEKVFTQPPSEYISQIQSDTETPEYITAVADGVVEKYIYVPGPVIDTYQNKIRRSPGSVYMLIRYDADDISTMDIPRYAYDSHLSNYIGDDRLIPIRVSSGVERYNQVGSPSFKYSPWYTSNLRAGDTFKAGSIIATLKPIDTGALRVIMELKVNGHTNGREYIPMTLDSYDASNDSYQYVAYLSTNDVINDKDMLLIEDGFCDYDGNNADTITIDPQKCYVRISTFVQYDDINESHELNTQNGHDYQFNYVNGWTFTNSYENSDDNPFYLLEPYTFIRSVMNYQEQMGTETTEDDPYSKEWYMTLREVPLVRASWMRNSGNVFDLFSILKNNHDFLYQAYDLLENNFTIDMKFYNTYGRSRYLNIGLNYGDDSANMVPLDCVNVSFAFGVKLGALVDSSDFYNRFTLFIKEYIESFNKIENYGQNIYITDLITQINIKFSDEIQYLEYYGVNGIDASKAQVIETWDMDSINALGYNKYIPEFINLFARYTRNDFVPSIDLTFLD